MKVWSTKYCLTTGIVAHEVTESEVSDGLVSYKDRGYTQYLHDEGRNWHRTREAASAHATTVLLKKIASVKKQLRRLEAMKFE
jgi:hypothetical protein